MSLLKTKNWPCELRYRAFTHLESHPRSYPPHPGFEEHWSPPVQRSSSPFHQNSSTHHHLVLYARRELFRCPRHTYNYISVKSMLSFVFVLCDLNPVAALHPLAYLLFVDFQCLFDIGYLWRANWQSLDFTGSKSTQVTDCFDVSGSNKLPKTTRPMRRINSSKK